MKKILLSLAALAFAATMNAQVWIGGEVGFTTNHTNGSDHTAMELTIAPDIGYSLSSNFSVAVALSYGHTSNGDGSKYGMPDMTISNVNSYSIMPYTCYTFAKAGNFAFFVISGLKYSIDHAQGLESNFNRFGVFVIPAIAFSAGFSHRRWSLLQPHLDERCCTQQRVRFQSVPRHQLRGLLLLLIGTSIYNQK